MGAVYVGIDVSKDRLDVHVLPSGEAFGIERSGKGVAELGQRLTAVSPTIVAVEATGGFETIVAAGLAGIGLPVAVVNPAQIRAFAKALGQRAKTDPIDAAIIARFAEAAKPEIRPLPDEATQLLGDLIGRRRQIVEMIGAERQRQKRLTAKHLAKSIARLIAALERELSTVDDEIDTAMRASPAWCEKEDLLSSVPGVGKIISRTLIAELPELGTLNAKQIAALAGLAPFTRQSGQWKGKSFIGGGRAQVRSMLYLGAMIATRCNQTLRVFYKRLRDAGKPRLVALVAVARKLLITLNAIVRTKTPWQSA